MSFGTCGFESHLSYELDRTSHIRSRVVTFQVHELKKVWVRSSRMCTVQMAAWECGATVDAQSLGLCFLVYVGSNPTIPTSERSTAHLK